MSDNRFRPRERGKVIPQSIVIYLGGSKVAFHGWEEVSVKKDLDNLATQFSFTIPERFMTGNYKFSPGVRVQVNVNGEVAITGRIEHISGRIGPKEKSMMVSGRSLTGDLVDCSHIGPTQYTSITLLDLAKELCKPFNIRVESAVSAPKVIGKVAIKPGDSVFEILQKQARIQGFFWITLRNGNLALTTAGNQRAVSRIEEDINMENGQFELDDSQRFSKYIVKGQLQGSDNFPGIISGIPSHEVLDKGVYRNRPLLQIAEHSVDGELVKKRAEWEAAHRLGKHIRLSCTVQGWAQQNGQLWAVNQLVKVKSTSLGVNGEFLCVGLENKKSNTEGTVTSLQFALKDAYRAEPVIPEGANSPFAPIVDFAKQNPQAVE